MSIVTQKTGTLRVQATLRLSIFYTRKCVQTLSSAQLFVTPWTVPRQAPPSMGFSRRKYWSELPFPTSGDLPDPGIELTSLVSPALASGFIIEPAGRFILEQWAVKALNLQMATKLPGRELQSSELHPEKWQQKHRKDLDKNMKPGMTADFLLLKTSINSSLYCIKNFSTPSTFQRGPRLLKKKISDCRRKSPCQELKTMKLITIRSAAV